LKIIPFIKQIQTVSQNLSDEIPTFIKQIKKEIKSQQSKTKRLFKSFSKINEELKNSRTDLNLLKQSPKPIDEKKTGCFGRTSLQ